MAYPATADSFTNPAGTSLLTSPDHASQHSGINTAVTNIETTLGTNAGTSVLKSFNAGEFPVRINASNAIQQTLNGGTINNTVIGTAKIVGGTINTVTMGTPTIVGGIYNNQIFGTPAITGGTANAITIGTPAMVGGSHNSATFGTPTILGGTVLSTLFAPRGFLLNGKISPSVSSNNLTVALKGIDGNDPSATNPVYCRIGDTIATITAALSNTNGAGTNWLQMGDAVLAGKEVDLFVYLYGNSGTPRITASRIPYAKRGDDFSLATRLTETSHLNVDPPGTSDVVELVGRFACTLSAGAGYTFSVPTFDSTNLIQRPIYETRRLGLNQAITPSTGTLVSGTFYNEEYQMVDRRCFLKSYLNLSALSSTCSSINYRVPFSSANWDYFTGRYYEAGNFSYVADWSLGSIYVQKSNNGNWGTNLQSIQINTFAVL